MNRQELKERTKRFALEVIKFVSQFTRNLCSNIIGQQLLRLATSIGANYRGACRAQSHKYFVSKISIVEEEANERIYWLELACESGIVNYEKAETILKEANELAAIFTASRRTARQRAEIKDPKI